ncbi:MAG: 5-formyltetrahydrofolate cyclo-ligase [Hyphomicrobiaceae bacterium]|nr:MAG: 5-formyltetrahydrofolate cyclo-ligase [Hyphomicrobiaceae bacterium]
MQVMDRAEVMRWRKVERKKLIGERLATPSDTRRRHADKIVASLEVVISEAQGLIISAYWPFRGEPDLRNFMAGVSDRGGRCALPVVVERGKPLIFRPWSPGEPLANGIWNIPVPTTTDEVVPDIVIAPVVGFDRACYRLGYGGGFFDRTLATMKNSPRKLGVGYRQQALLTIHPQPNDIPMDMMITEQGAWFPE